MQLTMIDAAPVRDPWWASAYLYYKAHAPEHRGKARLLRTLHWFGVRSGKPFVRKMRNDNLLAISPAEGYAPWSVGWTCFERGVWEPHVERVLARLAHPGDITMDIGANIGYFSAVLSRAVGPRGRVWAFEPVPATFRHLRLCQSLNGFVQMSPLQLALGSEQGTIEIRFDPKVTGSASIHDVSANAAGISVEVEIRRLDDLVDSGMVTAPQVIKIDVEGHERDVFAGAVKTLRTARPAILFEYNTEAAASAGWTFRDLAELLLSCARYRFYRVREGALQPISAPDTDALGTTYCDVLATCRPDLIG